MYHESDKIDAFQRASKVVFELINQRHAKRRDFAAESERKMQFYVFLGAFPCNVWQSSMKLSFKSFKSSIESKYF